MVAGECVESTAFRSAVRSWSSNALSFAAAAKRLRRVSHRSNSGMVVEVVVVVGRGKRMIGLPLQLESTSYIGPLFTVMLYRVPDTTWENYRNPQGMQP